MTIWWPRWTIISTQRFLMPKLSQRIWHFRNCQAFIIPERYLHACVPSISIIPDDTAGCDLSQNRNISTALYFIKASLAFHAALKTTQLVRIYTNYTRHTWFFFITVLAYKRSDKHYYMLASGISLSAYYARLEIFCFARIWRHYRMWQWRIA